MAEIHQAHQTEIRKKTNLRWDVVSQNQNVSPKVHKDGEITKKIPHSPQG